MNKKLTLGLIALLTLGFTSVVAAHPQQGPMTQNQSMQDWMMEHRQMHQQQQKQMQQMMDQMNQMQQMMAQHMQMMGQQQGIMNQSEIGQGMQNGMEGMQR